MFNPITNDLNNLWEQWNIRGLILFSLFLQIFLTICSPHRKCVQKGLLHFSIWTAYLLADWAANFCVGHIASNQVSGSKTGINNTHSHLLAFWAPFMLVHLGGPDTITAFSLEDNQLWSFIIQFTTCAYVFLLTVPGNRLWIPTVLVFVAGMIKYGEKIYALYGASNNNQSATGTRYLFFPKGLARSNFFAQVALKWIEFNLNFCYEAFFTKFPLLMAKAGCILRFVAISCVLIAFGLFFNVDKHRQGFSDFDVKVTYTLLCGAMTLDTIALLMLPFSTSFPKQIPDRYLDYLKGPHWSECKKKPFTKFTEYSTWLPLRRWNGSIPGFNMISYCHSMMTKYKCMKSVPSRYMTSSIFIRLHVVKNPFLFEFWEVNITELQKEGRVYSKVWWFDLIQRKNLINEEHIEDLKRFMNEEGIDFDFILIVWHIATCLCYIQEKDDQIREREFSKLLSDYMLYLLVVHSDIRSALGAHESFHDPLLEIMQFFNNDEDEAEACMNLLAGNQSRSPLLDRACGLANELGAIPITSSMKKWEIISLVWNLMLSHVSLKCNASFHLQHLSEGGEFISFFRILMTIT